MDRFLSLKYYFIPLPDPNFQFTKITLGIGILLILIGFVALKYRKTKLKDKIARKILKPYPGILIRYGFYVLLLLLFRERGIPYLSMRVWWFVILALFIYYFIKLALTYKAEYEKRFKAIHRNQSRDKYMPKRKK